MLTQLPKSHAAAREYVIFIRTKRKKIYFKKFSNSYLYLTKKKKEKKKRKKIA